MSRGKHQGNSNQSASAKRGKNLCASWAVLTSLALSRMKDGLSPRGLSHPGKRLCQKVVWNNYANYINICNFVSTFMVSQLPQLRCSQNLSILPNTWVYQQTNVLENACVWKCFCFPVYLQFMAILSGKKTWLTSKWIGGFSVPNFGHPNSFPSCSICCRILALLGMCDTKIVNGAWGF